MPPIGPVAVSRSAFAPGVLVCIRRQARSIDRHFETEGSGAPGSRHVPSVCSLHDAGDCPWGAAERARVEANLRPGSGCGFCRNVVESRSLSASRRCAPYCSASKAGGTTVSAQSLGDIEQSESWLDGLFRLNRVIAESGVPLEGNLFYEHHDRSFVDSPPDPSLRAKRDRFRSVAVSHARLLEIGVNGGHSAYAALTANPELTYFGVDICAHAYVRPAIEWLQAEFPGRVSFESGNSLKTLPSLRRQGHLCDAFHVDGAKINYLADILHCRQMMTGTIAIVIVDDTNGPLVAASWRRCLRWRIVGPLAEYPSQDDGEFSNEIAQLLAARPGRSEVQLVAAAGLRATWKMNQSARRIRRSLLRLDAKKAPTRPSV